MHTSQNRYTGAHRNDETVRVRGTLRCKRLGRFELVEATGEGSHDCESRFTISYYFF